MKRNEVRQREWGGGGWEGEQQYRGRRGCTREGGVKKSICHTATGNRLKKKKWERRVEVDLI